MIERPLVDFEPRDQSSPQSEHAFVLTNPQGYVFSLAFLTPAIVKITLTGPGRPAPPHSNIIYQAAPLAFRLLERNDGRKTAILEPPRPSELARTPDYHVHLSWDDTIVVQVLQNLPRSQRVRIFGDTPHKSYCLNQNGITRHTRLDLDSVHVGLGEKGAPLDLSYRRFAITGTDAASYDAYITDPLYKHTPFLVSLPKIQPGSDNRTPSRAAVGIYHASNSDATWDIGNWVNEPWTLFKKFEQQCGGLEEYIILGDGLSDVVTGFADLVGRPKLVPRDWLGYLASGMGLGESDEPIAQDLLSEWPSLCKKHDIPCSAIHLSSGYTVDEKGSRRVFTMNKKRYPDFAEMVKVFHRAGIKVTPNVKPYVLEDHPDFQKLRDAGALFTDPATGGPVVTRIWSSLPGINAKGSWVDLTSQAGQDWWRDGILGLIDLGVDAIWNDNNEYLLFDDDYICKNDSKDSPRAASQGSVKLGLIGRMYNTEMMAKASHDALLIRQPNRRPFVLTRSANVGTMKYAASTWSGDNRTNWKSLQGAVAMNLNAQLSLLQSYGSDVGGFGGPLPSPELFVRWVQMGVTHPRFCIHSFKPNAQDPTGSKVNNLPWMYPEVVDIVRSEIKRRYELLPFFNNLNWQSHLAALPPNTWLGWGEFASDPTLYTKELIEGFDYWLGHGQLLICGAYFSNQLSRRVYLPRTTDDDKVYYDLHAPYGSYAAGTWLENVSTPLQHFAVFAREGTALPIGKDVVTLTQKSGPAAEAGDGTKILTIDQGGLASYDDWRGLEIFPSPPRRHRKSSEYSYRWIEDDGVSLQPDQAVFLVRFSNESASKDSTQESVRVSVKLESQSFRPLWLPRLWIILPVGDQRPVSTAVDVATWKGRTIYAVQVEE
nr:putative neutral alpha-glucosidase ab precursor [Thecaphora frezii]